MPALKKPHKSLEGGREEILSNIVDRSISTVRLWKKKIKGSKKQWKKIFILIELISMVQNHLYPIWWILAHWSILHYKTAEKLNCKSWVFRRAKMIKGDDVKISPSCLWKPLGRLFTGLSYICKIQFSSLLYLSKNFLLLILKPQLRTNIFFPLFPNVSYFTLQILQRSVSRVYKHFEKATVSAWL